MNQIEVMLRVSRGIIDGHIQGDQMCYEDALRKARTIAPEGARNFRAVSTRDLYLSDEKGGYCPAQIHEIMDSGYWRYVFEYDLREAPR